MVTIQHDFIQLSFASPLGAWRHSPRLLKRITLLFLLGALGACGGGKDDPGGGQQPLAQTSTPDFSRERNLGHQSHHLG